MTVQPDCALIYTSFDDGRGRGGWRVKQSVGDDAAIAQLRELIRPNIRDTRPLPPFPTETERRAFTRRLEHRPLGGGRSGIWHTVAAGRDNTGRPGNAFVTAVVLSPRDAAMQHASDYWRSPYWPAPFGGDEVLGTALPADAEFVPSGLADPKSTLDFMFPPFPEVPRRGLLLALLDAVGAAVADPRRSGVALLVADADEGARWISAVCAWASPAWSRRFSWSTWERAEDLSHSLVQRLHLVCAPEDDAELVRQSGRVAFAPREDIPRFEDQFALGDEGELAASRTGRWCALAAPASDEAATAFEALTAIRSSAARPARGIDPEEALQRFAPARARGSDADLSSSARHTRAVLDDDGWLTDPPPAPPAVPLEPDDPQRQNLSALAQEMLRQLDTKVGIATDKTPTSRLAVRVLDFACRSNLDIDGQEPLANVIAALCGTGARDIVAECGELQSTRAQEFIAARLPAVADGAVLAWAGRAIAADPAAGSGAGSLAGGGRPKRHWLQDVDDLARRVLALTDPSNPQVARHRQQAGQLLLDGCLDLDRPYLESPVVAEQEDVLRALAMLTLMEVAPQDLSELEDNLTDRLAPHRLLMLLRAADIIAGERRALRGGPSTGHALLKKYFFEILCAALRADALGPPEQWRDDLAGRLAGFAVDLPDDSDRETLRGYLRERGLRAEDRPTAASRLLRKVLAADGARTDRFSRRG